jgi:hypothetical protein
MSKPKKQAAVEVSAKEAAFWRKLENFPANRQLFMQQLDTIIGAIQRAPLGSELRGIRHNVELLQGYSEAIGVPAPIFEQKTNAGMYLSWRFPTDNLLVTTPQPIAEEQRKDLLRTLVLWMSHVASMTMYGQHKHSDLLIEMPLTIPPNIPAENKDRPTSTDAEIEQPSNPPTQTGAQQSPLSVKDVVQRYDVNDGTVRRWCDKQPAAICWKDATAEWRISSTAKLPWPERKAKAEEAPKMRVYRCSYCDEVTPLLPDPPSQRCPKCPHGTWIVDSEGTKAASARANT